MKRVFLLLKVKTVNRFLFNVKTLSFCTNLFSYVQAAYNVGGHTISADTIQSSILGCRMSRPGQVGSLTFVRVLQDFRLIVHVGKYPHVFSRRKIKERLTNIDT